MRYSVLSAPIACSLALHVAVLNFGWQLYASDSGASAPWRRPVLRASLVAPAPPPSPQRIAVPLPPSAPPAPGLARIETNPAPTAAEPTAPKAASADATPPDAQAQPAERPDSAFMDPGGVDQMARPLVEPQMVLPTAPSGGRLNWVVSFDLLIDEQGKAVRVENVSAALPRDIIDQVLVAFYTAPYEPARLAGRPVAIRQRFSVQPFPDMGDGITVLDGNAAAVPPCGGAC